MSGETTNPACPLCGVPLKWNVLHDQGCPRITTYACPGCGLAAVRATPEAGAAKPDMKGLLILDDPAAPSPPPSPALREWMDKKVPVSTVLLGSDIAAMLLANKGKVSTQSIKPLTDPRVRITTNGVRFRVERLDARSWWDWRRTPKWTVLQQVTGFMCWREEFDTLAEARGFASTGVRELRAADYGWNEVQDHGHE